MQNDFFHFVVLNKNSTVWFDNDIILLSPKIHLSISTNWHKNAIIRKHTVFTSTFLINAFLAFLVHWPRSVFVLHVMQLYISLLRITCHVWLTRALILFSGLTMLHLLILSHVKKYCCCTRVCSKHDQKNWKKMQDRRISLTLGRVNTYSTFCSKNYNVLLFPHINLTL